MLEPRGVSRWKSLGARQVEGREGQRENEPSGQVGRAAALTAEMAAQSEKRTAAACDQSPGLDALVGHIEAPNMGAGGSHPQATMMHEESAAPAATSHPFATPAMAVLLLRPRAIVQQGKASQTSKEQAVEHDRGQLCEVRRL